MASNELSSTTKKRLKRTKRANETKLLKRSDMRICAYHYCKSLFAYRSNKIYCSDTCRKRQYHLTRGHDVYAIKTGVIPRKSSKRT